MTEDSNPASDRLIFCYSDASNVGILSFQAAIRVAQDAFGVFSSIAGIGSKNPPMIRAAKSAGERVVIDGCPIGCAKKSGTRTRSRLTITLSSRKLGLPRLTCLMSRAAILRPLERKPDAFARSTDEIMY